MIDAVMVTLRRPFLPIEEAPTRKKIDILDERSRLVWAGLSIHRGLDSTPSPVMQKKIVTAMQQRVHQAIEQTAVVYRGQLARNSIKKINNNGFTPPNLPGTRANTAGENFRTHNDYVAKKNGFALTHVVFFFLTGSPTSEIQKPTSSYRRLDDKDEIM